MCHPNDAGYSALASAVYKSVFLGPVPTMIQDLNVSNLNSEKLFLYR